MSNRSSATTVAHDSSRSAADREVIDVRGPRFSATLTAVLMLTAFVVRGPVGTVLVAVQIVQFATATLWGVAASPWACLFRFARARLEWGPPSTFEDAAPPRFAQLCGLVVSATAMVALLAQVATVGWALVAVVFALAVLLAATGLCVGCQMWVLGLRLRQRLTASGGQ